MPNDDDREDNVYDISEFYDPPADPLGVQEFCEVEYYGIGQLADMMGP